MLKQVQHDKKDYDQHTFCGIMPEMTHFISDIKRH